MQPVLNSTAKKIEKVFHDVFIVIALCLLVQWLLQDFLKITDPAAKIIDWGVWFFLFLETMTLVSLAHNKWQYLTSNWINIVILIIFFPLFWFHTTSLIFLRFVRLFILFRFFVPSFKVMKEALMFNGIGLTLLFALMLAILSGILMSQIDPAITNIGDGIWWAWETITTVGYGDEAPSSTHGRVLAVIVMILGAVLFSIITANLSAYFVSKSRLTKDAHQNKLEKKEIHKILLLMQQQLDEIQKKLEHKK